MTDSRTLFLLRHAKSSWKDPSLRDRDRPLNARGERDAPRMARRLSSRGEVPELILSSPAVRALSTAKIFAEVLGLDEAGLQIDPDLYGAGFGELMRIARETDDSVGALMMVAHDPGLTEMAGAFSGYEIGHVPTCGVVTIAFDTSSWGKADVQVGRVTDFDYPKKDAG